MHPKILALLFLVGCIENGLVVPPESPARLEGEAGCLVASSAMEWFGEVVVGENEPLTRGIVLSNQCDMDLVLFSASTDGPTFRAALPDDRTLDSQASVEIPITFDPQTHYAGITELTLDSDLGSVEVALAGRGLAPVISMEPEVDLPPTPSHCSAEHVVTVGNTGSYDLDIHGAELRTPSDELALGDFRPRVLAPGEEVRIPLSYTSRDDNPDAAWLHVFSDDPVSPEAVIAVTARTTDDERLTELHQVPSGPVVDVLWTIDRAG